MNLYILSEAVSCYRCNTSVSPHSNFKTCGYGDYFDRNLRFIVLTHCSLPKKNTEPSLILITHSSFIFIAAQRHNERLLY